MRRTLIAGLLVFGLSLPMCAQRWGRPARSGGGSARTQPSFRGSGFRSQPAYPRSGAPRFESGVRIGGGFAFGHNPRWVVGTRSHWSFERSHRRYTPSYVYPYFFSPYYASGYYDSFDSYSPYPSFAAVVAEPEAYVVSTPQPYYPYFPSQQVGLDTQMREEHVGIYRSPIQPEAAPAAQPAEPENQAPPAEQPLTLLVYRDGRQAEIRNYAVVGQTLWIFTEQRAQKVALESVDLDATRKANLDRGVEFPVTPK